MRPIAVALLLCCACQTSPRRTRIGLEGFSDDQISDFKSGRAVLPGVTLTVSTPASPIRAGDAVDIAYEARSTEYALGAVTLAYSTGGDFTDIGEVEPGAGTVRWTTPLIDTSAAQLRLTASFAELPIDNLVLSDRFTIDAAAALLPDASLVSNSPTNDPLAAVDIASCEGGSWLAIVVFAAGDATPNPGDERFFPCTEGIAPVALGDDGERSIVVVARDPVGHRSAPLVLGPVVLDRVAPLPPQISLVSAALTNDPVVTVAVADCADFASLGLATTPALDNAAACGATRTLTLAVDGDALIYAVGVDAAGNASDPSAPLSVTLDRSAPVVSLAPPPPLRPATLYDIAVMVTGDHLGSMSLDYSLDSGATFTAIASDVPVAASVPWTTPSTASLTNVRLRLTATDLAGNSASTTTSDFTIDAVGPPAPQLFLLNGVSGYTGSTGPTSFTNPIATFELHVAADDVSTITDYCIKRLAAQPAATSTCWKPAPSGPQSTLDIVGQPVRLGFLPGPVTLYAFVRDAAGNVSTAISPEPAGRGKDHASVRYDPGSPPTIDNFFVTASASSCPEFAPAEVSSVSGSDLYLRWNVDFVATEGNDPETIAVEYSSDDVNYTPLVGPSGNGTNGTACSTTQCSAATTFTGCYKWTNHTLAPGYAHFRLRAQNKKGIVTVRSSVPPLNVADKIRFVAGNSDPGIDGNATSATFLARATNQFIQFSRHSLVVNEWGVMFYLDPDNGVLWVDPETGTLSRVARTTGIATDGLVGATGPTATSFHTPRRMWMTHENDVLVWDYRMIRRIVVDPATGAPKEVLTELVNPGNCVGAQCDCTGYCSIVPLPNGDYLFAPEQGIPNAGSFSIHRYTKANGTVSSVSPHGLGYSQWPSADIGTCLLSDMTASFDPDGTVTHLHAAVTSTIGQCAPTGGVVTMDANGRSVTDGAPGAQHVIPYALYNGTFVFTGLDGYHYQYWDNVNHGLIRVHKDRTTYDRVLRNFGPGPATTCPAGVHPKLCHPNAHDVFVDKNQNVFWSSYGKIRAVDFGDNGQDSYGPTGPVAPSNDDQVVDLFGQGLDYGEGQDALTARIAFSSALSAWNDGTDEHVTYVDNINSQLRQATVGKTVTRRAGNGVQDYAPIGGSGAASESFYAHGETSFLQDPSGRIYGFTYDRPSRAYYLAYTDSASDPWHGLVGGSGPSGHRYYAVDDINKDVGPGSDFTFDFYGAFPFGLTAQRVLFAFTSIDNNPYSYYANGMIKSYDKTTGAQRHIAGRPGPVDTTCPDGMNRNYCYLNYHYYAVARSRAIYDAPRSRWISRDYVSGEHLLTFDDDGVGGPTGPTGLTGITGQTGPTALTGIAGPHKGSVGPRIVPSSFTSWTWRREAADTVDALYVCQANGRIARGTHDGTTWTFTELGWPITTMSCAGQDMTWSTDNTRLLFIYKQFGLSGIAAYMVGPP